MNNKFIARKSYEEGMRELGSKFIARIYKGGYYFSQATDGVYLLGIKIPQIDEIDSIETIKNITVVTGKNGTSTGFKNDAVNINQQTDPKVDFIQGFDFSSCNPVIKIGKVDAPAGDSIFIDGNRNLLWNGNVIQDFEINQATRLMSSGSGDVTDASNYFTDGNVIVYGGETAPLNMKSPFRFLDKNTVVTDSQVIVQGKVLEGISPLGIIHLQNGHYINDDGAMFYSGIKGGEGGVVPGLYSKESLSFGIINIAGAFVDGFILIGISNLEDTKMYTSSMVYKGKLISGPWEWNYNGSENGYSVYCTERYSLDEGSVMMDTYNKIVYPQKNKINTNGLEDIPANREALVKIGNGNMDSYYADRYNNIYEGSYKVIDFDKLAKLQYTNLGLFEEIIASVSDNEALSEFIKRKLKFYNTGYNVGKRLASILR